jgi:hypothetical protein
MMAMSPGPAFLLVSAMALAAGLRSGLATSVPEPAGAQDAAGTPPGLAAAVGAASRSGPAGPPQTSPYAALLDAANAGVDAEGLAALKRGVSARARDPKVAARTFGDAATKLPGLQDWALLLQAESACSAPTPI